MAGSALDRWPSKSRNRSRVLAEDGMSKRDCFDHADCDVIGRIKQEQVAKLFLPGQKGW